VPATGSTTISSAVVLTQDGGQQLIPDAFRRLREADGGRFDAVIVDMPDPDITATPKLYSVEFYALVRRVLTPGGRTVVQAGSPYFAPRAYSYVLATVRSSGLGAAPYHVDVPSLGDWGFELAGPGTAPPLRVHAPQPLRFLGDLDEGRGGQELRKGS